MTHKGHIGRLFNYLLFISVFLVHLHQLLLSFVVSQLNFMKMCRFDFPRENRVSCGWEKASVVFFLSVTFCPTCSCHGYGRNLFSSQASFIFCFIVFEDLQLFLCELIFHLKDFSGVFRKSKLSWSEIYFYLLFHLHTVYIS